MRTRVVCTPSWVTPWLSQPFSCNHTRPGGQWWVNEFVRDGLQEEVNLVTYRASWFLCNRSWRKQLSQASGPDHTAGRQLSTSWYFPLSQSTDYIAVLVAHPGLNSWCLGDLPSVTDHRYWPPLPDALVYHAKAALFCLFFYYRDIFLSFVFSFCFSWCQVWETA